MKFKINDVVVVKRIDTPGLDASSEVYKSLGKQGVVIRVRGNVTYPFYVKFKDQEYEIPYKESELELHSPTLKRI